MKKKSLLTCHTKVGLVAEHRAQRVLCHALIGAHVSESIRLADQVDAAAVRDAGAVRDECAVLHPFVADRGSPTGSALQNAPCPTEQWTHVERLQCEYGLLLWQFWHSIILIQKQQCLFLKGGLTNNTIDILWWGHGCYKQPHNQIESTGCFIHNTNFELGFARKLICYLNAAFY